MHGTPLLPAEDRNLPDGKIMPEYFKVSFGKGKYILVVSKNAIVL